LTFAGYNCIEGRCEHDLDVWEVPMKRGRILFWAWIAVGGLILAGWLAGCRRSPPPLDVRLSDLVVPTLKATSRPPDHGTLRMAVAAVNSPRITLAYYSRLADYLAAHLGMRGELVQGKTYAEINDLVREGNVTLAMVCTNPYVEGQEDFGMEALAVPEVNGEAVYYSYLIVPQDSPASSLEDLRGRTFAFTDPLSNSGRLVIVYQLALMGETSESFFSRYIFTYSHEHAIKAVAEGLVDGAAVDSLIYDYFAAVEPERVAGTKVIARYGPFGSNPVVVHPNLDPELKTRIQQLLLNMHQDPEGQAILSALRIDRFVLPDDAAYDSVREMRRRIRQAPGSVTP
ncbi:MAG: phosphate/phosphite/phosphonate ABC transporter substrate-binding protein, partial [Chloroflexi bacterium]